MLVLPWRGRARLWTFLIALAASASMLIYIKLSNWFTYPHIGIVGLLVTGAAIAFGVTAISTGIRNRRALYASLIVVAVGGAIYFPFLIKLAKPA
jgi:peptide/nickel transport system permease protein